MVIFLTGQRSATCLILSVECCNFPLFLGVRKTLSGSNIPCLKYRTDKKKELRRGQWGKEKLIQIYLEDISTFLFNVKIFVEDHLACGSNLEQKDFCSSHK